MQVAEERHVVKERQLSTGHRRVVREAGRAVAGPVEEGTVAARAARRQDELVDFIVRTGGVPSVGFRFSPSAWLAACSGAKVD